MLSCSSPEKPPVVVPLWVNPVQHLRAQSTVPKFHRRPRKSEIVSSIQGAPCRKLPELENTSQKKTPTPISVAESEVVSVQVKEDNPFRYLLKDTDQGKIAFAFYVMDCWEQQKSLQDAGDKEEFIRQCSKWWTDLPTPYRRIYWSKEIEFTKKKNSAKILGRTWLNNNFKEKSNQENDASDSSGGKRKSSPECSQPRKLIKKEDVVDVSEHTEQQPLPQSPASVDPTILDNEFEFEERKPKIALVNVKKERSSELLKAFSNFQKVYRENVSKENPRASRMEVKRELGRRWKLLGEKQKLKYLDSNYSPISAENEKIVKKGLNVTDTSDQDNESKIIKEIRKEDFVTVRHKVKDEFSQEDEMNESNNSPDRDLVKGETIS